MAHIYMPGDPRLVDQLVYELKSKGIFDQFRKDCIADVDTRPAYQNLRQRVESSVAAFLACQCWQPDLNKNQLREKLRKHILDGNYLEQGVERIVDQVVNPKVASVFIPQVEDLVYNYLGIARKKSVPETSNGKLDDLLPTDLEAVSPGSVKSEDDKDEAMETEVSNETKINAVQEKPKDEIKEALTDSETKEQTFNETVQMEIDFDKNSIPLPSEEIKVENIPLPENSPPKVELANIQLPKELDLSTDIPLPDELPKDDKDQYFKPINSDDDSSSDSSLRRNMSPLTPIRNFNNENSCDAQQAFENNSEDNKGDEKKEPSSFRFTIETKELENSSDAHKIEKKDEQTVLSYQFNNQININNFNTPMFDDSSNSHNLQIDYESDANSKANIESKIAEIENNSEDCKKERKPEEKKISHKSSHRSRDSHRHSSSKDKRSDSKTSSSKDSKHDKQSSKDDYSKSKSSNKETSRDRSDKKDSRDSSKHRSSHKSSSSYKDSKSHKSSSSSHRHSSKTSDEKKSSSSSSHKDKERSSEKNSKDKSSRENKDSKSSTHKSDKDKKSSSKSKHDEKDKDKKNKKDTDDHYGLSGRGNHSRRSTDRDSNDGSSSSKGSHNQSIAKSAENKKDLKSGSSKSDNTSTSGDSASPSDKENVQQRQSDTVNDVLQARPVVRIETHLEMPIVSPPRLPFVPDVTLRKPKFAANLEEAKRLMKMRRFLDEEQKRMNQEAALLLEFQANVRPSLSQAYSSIPGPELEFACIGNAVQPTEIVIVQSCDQAVAIENKTITEINAQNDNTTSIIDFEIVESIDNTQVKTDLIENLQGAVTPTELKDNAPSYEANSEGDTETLNNDVEENLNIKAEVNIDEAAKDIKIDMVVKDTIRIELNEDDIASTRIEIVEHTEDFKPEIKQNNEKHLQIVKDITLANDTKGSEFFEVTVITEEVSESEDLQSDVEKDKKDTETITEPKLKTTEDDDEFKYFTEQEKYVAELERDRFTRFVKSYEKSVKSQKVYLINCEPYEESIVEEVLESLGDFEVVNYQRNGHLKLPKTCKNIVKNVNVASEVSLPIDYEMNDVTRQTNFNNVFSPVKSDCSFELSNDYDAKIEEMVNKTSRQEIMEIILGNVISEGSPHKMPKIDYFTDSKMDAYEHPLKRKMQEVETTVNNNRHILTPNKIRKMSTSDQITSTTQEIEERPNNKAQSVTRSKYLGRARRVGLPRPRRNELPNSPSSDKSVENYEQNGLSSQQTPNGRIKTTQRSKIQRYDTSDLYKPKLHYLSRRNNIT